MYSIQIQKHWCQDLKMVKTNSDMSSVNKFDGAKSLEDVIWTLVNFLSRNWPRTQFSRMKDSSIEDDRLWLTKEMSDTMLVVLLTTCKQGFYFVCIKEAYIRWLCPLKRNSQLILCFCFENPEHISSEHYEHSIGKIFTGP